MNRLKLLSVLVFVNIIISCGNKLPVNIIVLESDGDIYVNGKKQARIDEPVPHYKYYLSCSDTACLVFEDEGYGIYKKQWLVFNHGSIFVGPIIEIRSKDIYSARRNGMFSDDIPVGDTLRIEVLNNDTIYYLKDSVINHRLLIGGRGEWAYYNNYNLQNTYFEKSERDGYIALNYGMDTLLHFSSRLDTIICRPSPSEDEKLISYCVKEKMTKDAAIMKKEIDTQGYAIIYSVASRKEIFKKQFPDLQYVRVSNDGNFLLLFMREENSKLTETSDYEIKLYEISKNKLYEVGVGIDADFAPAM